MMNKYMTFIKSHKNELKWAIVGVLLISVAYFSYTALVALIGMLFVASPKQQTDKIEEVQAEAETFEEEYDAFVAHVKVEVEKTEKTASKEVDDFIDGEWK
jgi:hypothetical protein